MFQHINLFHLKNRFVNIRPKYISLLIRITLFGIILFFKPHPPNAQSSITVTPFGIIMLLLINQKRILNFYIEDSQFKYSN